MKIIILLISLGIYFIPGISRETVINICSIIWFIFSILYILYIYYKRDKEYETTFKEEYCLTIPCVRPPEVLGFLLTCSVKKEYLIASIMELIRKKAINIEKRERDYILKDNKNCKCYLSRVEEYVKKWLFKNIGNSDGVSLRAIKKEAKNNSGYFYACYKEWTELVTLECARYSFFESKKDVIENTLLYFVISYLFMFYNLFITHHFIIGIFMFILTTAFIVYVNKFYKRSKEINREYEEWMAYKRYILNKDNLINEFDIDTINMYAVYSKVLGVDKEFKKVINKICREKETECDEDSLISAIKSGIIDDINKSLSNGIKRSWMAVTLFVRNIGSK